jgi:hypothetical protein
MEEKHHVRAFHERLNVLVKENIKKGFLQGFKEKAHKTLKLMTSIPNQHLVKWMGETNLNLFSTCIFNIGRVCTRRGYQLDMLNMFSM